VTSVLLLPGEMTANEPTVGQYGKLGRYLKNLKFSQMSQKNPFGGIFARLVELEVQKYLTSFPYWLTVGSFVYIESK